MPLGSIKGSAYPYASNRAVVTNRRGIQRGGSLVYHQTWPAPSTAVANDILTATLGPTIAQAILTPALNGSLTSGGVATLLAAQGPFTGGRNVVVTVTHATSIVAISGVITGTDVYGVKITENWNVTATGTSKTYVSARAFKRVTSITLNGGGADTSTDTVTVGDGNILGLDVILPAALGLTGAALKEVVNAALVTTGVLVAGGFAISAAGVISVPAAGAAQDLRGTYAPASAPNGAQNYDLWYISDAPEYSGGA
jgi:hypothetical protein